MKKLILVVLVAFGCSKSNDPAPAVQKTDPNYPVSSLLALWSAYGGYYLPGSVPALDAYYDTSISECVKGGCYGGKNYNLYRLKFTNYITYDGYYLFGKSLTSSDPTPNLKYKLAGDSIIFGNQDSVWHYSITDTKAQFWRKLSTGTCSGCRRTYYYQK